MSSSRFTLSLSRRVLGKTLRTKVASQHLGVTRLSSHYTPGKREDFRSVELDVHLFVYSSICLGDMRMDIVTCYLCGLFFALTFSFVETLFHLRIAFALIIIILLLSYY
ncbi:MAG: hypothetical protein ACI90V_004264 [Bacillariaceae sp.]|jgi:hypothetical protein